jgi:hypothetical protein
MPTFIFSGLFSGTSYDPVPLPIPMARGGEVFTIEPGKHILRLPSTGPSAFEASVPRKTQQ